MTERLYTVQRKLEIQNLTAFLERVNEDMRGELFETCYQGGNATVTCDTICDKGTGSSTNSISDSGKISSKREKMDAMCGSCRRAHINV